MNFDYERSTSLSRIEAIKKDLEEKLGKNYPIKLYTLSDNEMSLRDWEILQQAYGEKTLLLVELTNHRFEDVDLAQMLLRNYQIEFLDGPKNNLILVYDGPIPLDKRRNNWQLLMREGLDKRIGKELEKEGPHASVNAVIATLEYLYRENPERVFDFKRVLSSSPSISDFS